jgi:hypothetical protein
MNQYGAVLYALDIGQAELAAMKDRMWPKAGSAGIPARR